MLTVIVLALVLIFLSVAVHSAIIILSIQSVRGRLNAPSITRVWPSLILLSRFFVVLLASHLMQATLWAIVYIAIGQMARLEQAVYFSMTSYTTVGYGDELLKGPLRLLGPIEAATGILMFGWSTALTVALFARMLHGPYPFIGISGRAHDPSGDL